MSWLRALAFNIAWIGATVVIGAYAGLAWLRNNF